MTYEEFIASPMFTQFLISMEQDVSLSSKEKSVIALLIAHDVLVGLGHGFNDVGLKLLFKHHADFLQATAKALYETDGVVHMMVKNNPNDGGIEE